MAELPSATTRIDESAGPVSAGTRLVAVFAAVPLNADGRPKQYSSVSAAIAVHGYAEGLDYAALHVQKTKLPFLLVPLPIATPGVVGRVNTSGNTGTSVVSVAAGSSGALDEVDLAVRVLTGGTVGTSQIVIEISLNGVDSFSPVRLGTATSYVIPRIGLTLGFTVGTLVAGETVLTAHSTAPMWDNTGLTLGKGFLAASKKLPRNWMVVGNAANSTVAGYVVTAINDMETSHGRFGLAKLQVRDRLPLASLSDVQARMTGSPSITFAEVGDTGDTITRGAGSFVTDGAVNGDTIRVTGAVASAGANNVVGVVATVDATVLTLGSTDLVNEGPISGVGITFEPTLTFGDNGGSEDTLTRNRGSWLDDGFRVGDVFTIAGTASNNVTKTITAVTATQINVATGSFAAEVIGTHGVTVSAGETDAQWVASIDAAFASVDAQKRIDLGAGYGRVLSPVLGCVMRRPWQWADNIRAYQHDVHVSTWEKDLGPMDGWTLENAAGEKVEHDERTDGGLLAARFTCARTWSLGPEGAFTAMSLTRASDASLLSRTHNMAVANVAQATCQLEAENAIGQSLVLNADGTATGTSLGIIKARVDSSLKRNLLQNRENEGPRASSAEWNPATNDVLNVPGAAVNATLELNLRGTIEKINTTIKIASGG